jgi:response regulator NasT
LELLGHTVVGDAATAAQAERLFQEQNPDLVLMDIHLDGCDGIELAEKLLAKRPCPVVILSASQIEVAVGRFKERMRLVAENQSLSQNLETRKLVEKAKGIIMQRLKLSEGDAHRRLQMESQKRRMNLADVAKKIIESEEILGGS